jgi:hypothetical protein
MVFSIIRQFFIYSIILTLGLTTVACGGSPQSPASSNQPGVQQSQPQQANPSSTQASPAGAQTNASSSLNNGQYNVQQVTYDDSAGEYNVFLLNTPPGQPSIFRTTNLPMARLTDEEVKSNKGNYLNVEGGQPSLHLSEDFRIEYLHNVTETVSNPQTGQPETVVVRQEPSFWAPFAGALAGQALGSLLFTPHYYVPPLYQPGGVLIGYGGYGRTYTQAVDRYQERYQAPPAAVRNRQTLRTTGRLRSPSYGQSGTTRTQPQVGDRPTGSGYGSSTLRRSNRSNPSQLNRSRGFGSGTRSLGRRRR